MNKIITASTAIEYGLTNPDEVLSVPGSIDMGGVTVHDAWEHGVMPYTTTGIFGKSSNVGTLMLAQRVGPHRYAEMLDKFGLGQRTGVGLPGESAGLVPPIDQWSGSSFANLPIGQGLSMTLLQMTGMYQAIANDGVRIPPRIIKSTIAPDGTRTDEPRPEGVRVVSARDGADRAKHVARHHPEGSDRCSAGHGVRRRGGRAIRSRARRAPRSRSTPAAAATTTTSTGSRSRQWCPPNDPRYVVGVMMDNPHRTADGSPGTTAAPLIHNLVGVAAAARERAAVARPRPAAGPAGLSRGIHPCRRPTLGR